MLEAIYENGRNEWDEFSTELVVKHNGQEIRRESDAGEPEDQTFGRDWSWVADAIDQAYALGVEDGKKQK